MKNVLCVIALGMFTLAACQGQSTPAPTQIPASLTPISTLESPTSTVTPEPTDTATPENTPSPTLEAVQYNTIDINHPLETCPVLTDAEIPSYYDWVNGEIQKGGAYLPFGPNAKLIPPIPQQPGGNYPDYQGVVFGSIVWNSSMLKGIKPGDLPYRNLEQYIACYNYSSYKKLIFSDLWLNPNNRSKPSLLFSSFNFDYGYGKKYTDSDLKNLIKNWKATNPFYFVPPVATGGDYAKETDLLKLSIDAANQFPDIATGIANFENTGDASGLAGKGVYLQVSPPD
jgi:hypothetical protein